MESTMLVDGLITFVCFATFALNFYKHGKSPYPLLASLILQPILFVAGIYYGRPELIPLAVVMTILLAGKIYRQKQ